MSGREGARVLVTGGAGFIGANLADRLAREGCEVVVLDALARDGVERNLAWLQAQHGRHLGFVQADVRDRAAVARAADGADVVFHLAAQVAVTTSLVDPRDDFEVNLLGTLNVMEAARRRRTPVVFASTNKVYGDLSDIALELQDDAWLPADDRVRANGVSEARPLDFHTPYGCSKGGADQYVVDYARSYDLPTCVLRMSCIYGPRQMGTEDQGWVAHFLISALKGELISIYGDGRQVRDILHVADAVDAYVAAWDRIEAVKGRAFNLGGGAANAVSLRQVLARIADLVGGQPQVAYAGWRPGDQRYFVADARAAREALGLAAPRPWREGLADLAGWLAREHGVTAGVRAEPPRLRAAAPVSASPTNGGPAHVLLTTDAVGGVWTYALDLARGLAADGVRVTLAVLGPAASPDQAAQARRAPGIDLVDTGLPLDWLAPDRAEVRRAAQGIADLARRRGVDLVHLNSPALAAESTFPIPVVGVAHSCVKTWWEAVERGPLPADFQWRADLLAAGYAACDLVLAPSAAFAAATERAYGVRPLVVRNGRSAPEAAPAARRARRVVTAGRLWDRGKDVATLDAAAARLDAPVLAYGGTQGPGGASCDFAHLKLAGMVDAGALSAGLGEAAVFASAALYEPFGLVVLEAAQAGCALVLSDIPTFRELWDGAAVFVLPRDSDAFACALQRLLDDPEETAVMAAAARDRAGRYGVEPFVRGMRCAYAAVCGPREAAA